MTPDVQDRLVEHIEAALAGVEDNSAEYFEVVTTKIPYLEATIKETLRLYPPVPRLVRRVGVESYNLGGVILKKDMSVEIPTYAIHHMRYKNVSNLRFLIIIHVYILCFAASSTHNLKPSSQSDFWRKTSMNWFRTLTFRLALVRFFHMISSFSCY